MKFHVDQSDGVSEYPSDWNCHPDTNLTDIVGEEIGEGNTCSQGYHGQHKGMYAGTLQGIRIIFSFIYRKKCTGAHAESKKIDVRKVIRV